MTNQDRYEIQGLLSSGSYGSTSIAIHKKSGKVVCIKKIIPDHKTQIGKETGNKDNTASKKDSENPTLMDQANISENQPNDISDNDVSENPEIVNKNDSKNDSKSDTDGLTNESNENPQDKIIPEMKEIQILSELDHPCIYSIFDYWIEDDAIYIVLEYLENQTIFEYVNKNGRINEYTARKLFAQLISAISYLHSKNISHRDIKPENLMLDKYYNLRLVDFGLSTTFDAKWPLMSTICGSIAYAPPEMIRGEKYSTSADIWSCGAVLYVMCAGTLPFHGNNLKAIADKVLYEDVKYPSNFSPSLKDLLSKMLEKDPFKRASISMIQNHPWIESSCFSHVNQLMKLTEDFEAIRSVKNIGLDISNIDHRPTLKLHQKENLITDETVAYRIFRRENLTKKLYSFQNLQGFQTKPKLQGIPIDLSSVRKIVSNNKDPSGIMQRRQTMVQMTSRTPLNKTLSLTEKAEMRRRVSHAHMPNTVSSRLVRL
ncbi:CAMK family protein kinase [Tritrichomonas foetus]|uniref:CAMK family protein kinase n=1 Tax=Tritrichomonas foetus TaxID=1144522 RepID=A0A1J4K5K6_9EUKA|nr:CAMK family protein kinase [Tritrichomonas foetus]|eukprot:OHT04757.1 CAMK family protein kinase [Tritrichomonas foetus]